MTDHYVYAERDEDSDDELDQWSASSLASTSKDVIFQYGRRYPNYRDNATHFPRGDELARRNEAALHDLYLCLFDDKLFQSPISPSNVLDVRAGQLGLWSKNMADIYPSAHVTGTDAQFEPDTEGRENLSFIRHSFAQDIWVLDEITQIYGKFNLIYIRGIFGSQVDFPTFYKECLDHLNPGGYIEQSEIIPYVKCDDDTGREDSVMSRLSNMIPKIEQLLGVNLNPAESMAQVMAEAGFVDIKQDSQKAAWSPWYPAGTKEHAVGRKFQMYYETGLQGWIVAALVGRGEFPQDEVDAMCEAARIEVQQNDQHWYSYVVTVTARKPLESE